MKTKLINLIFASLIATGTIFTGCQSSVRKEDAAQNKINEAEAKLAEAQAEAKIESMKIATAEQWLAYKTETEIKISEYEIRIKALKTQMKKPGETFDELYKKRIEQLELKITDLKDRLKNYEKNQSGWEAFKREFNHDMEELGKALIGLTNDSKN